MFIVPSNESRKFYNFTLSNNIPVVIIEDSKIESNTFALRVNSGFYQDNKIYGLAHFLEHMIFMGSKKYPEENHFNKIIALANGFTNAYTASRKTVYYFTGNNKYFTQLIDIFYNLIKDPLISKSSLSREREAVNNEHQKNLLSDIWRLNYLIGLLTDKDHPMNTFGTGNKETLNREKIYQELHEFHQKHYHPENISIVLSIKKLDYHIKNLLNKTFGRLKDETVPKLELSKPFNQNKNKIYYLKPMKETNLIKIIFTIPKLNYQENYLLLLEKLLVDDSINSLSKYLIKENLISMLDLSLNEDNENYQLVELTLLITNKGKSNIYDIITITFNYLQSLTSLELSKYLKVTQNILTLDFNYEEKPDTTQLVQQFIDDISEVPTKNLYNHTYDISKVNLVKFKDDIKKYFIPEESLIIQMYQDNHPHKYETEPYYNLQYHLVSDKILIGKSKLDEIRFIFNTTLIPSNPKILNKKNDITNKNKMLVFDKEWKTPKVLINLIYQYDFISNPINYLKTILTINILNYHIDEELAELINYGYSFSFNKMPRKNKIITSLKGWNQNWDKILPIFNKVIKKTPKDEFFSLNIKEYQEYLNKIKYLDSWKMIDYLQDNFILEHPSYQILLKNKISLDKKEYHTILRKILNSPVFYYQYGNYDKDYSEFFNSDDYYPLKPKIIQLKSKVFDHPNTSDKNKAIKILLPLGKYTLKNYTDALLINNIISEKFFNEIRTRQQLGYLVNLSYELISEQMFITQKIQNHLDIKKSLKALVKFNKNIKLSKEEFESIKDTLIADLKKPEENFFEKVNLHLNEIINGTMEFNRKKEVIKNLGKITFQNFQKLVNNIFKQKAIVLILK